MVIVMLIRSQAVICNAVHAKEMDTKISFSICSAYSLTLINIEVLVTLFKKKCLKKDFFSNV